jgi:hypothetical protein
MASGTHCMCVDQRLLLPLEKSDGLVYHSRLSGFLILEPSSLVGGRHSHNDNLMYSSLYGQNTKQVLTIPGENALTVESMDGGPHDPGIGGPIEKQGVR